MSLNLGSTINNAINSNTPLPSSAISQLTNLFNQFLPNPSSNNPSSQIPMSEANKQMLVSLTSKIKINFRHST